MEGAHKSLNIKTPDRIASDGIVFFGDYDTLPANLPPSPRQPQRTRAGHEKEGVGRGFGDGPDVVDQDGVD